MSKYPIYSIQRFNCNDFGSDFYINTFKNHLVNHGFVEEPHRHNSYVLVLFTNGSGTHDIDFDSFRIQPGSVFFMQPGQIHHWDLSDDIDGFVVFYSQEMYNLYFRQKTIDGFSFYSSLGNSPEIVFDSKELKTIEPYFFNILEEYQGNKLMKQDKILNLLDCIHIEIARKYEENNVLKAHSYNVKIKEFNALLELHFWTEKTAAFYASQLHITLKHLNRICSEILKKTTTQVIAGRVILEAKRMLMDKKRTVNEIATMLGFDDYSYFVRLFKKHTAMTPTAFRFSKR
ncbi:AraC family transcriptional regulator [Flavobacterium gilvum]|uniref:AraC family transcriptional regulator n=1 Tax=Flavobacterium gilvum TaxID=1492737 RepID=A0AAC9N3P5_9FLAO|nr:helix-turn-helix domain-containing protein [Flavobacterium gilvum]AOW09235.1 AraC family transcriptional regulator [Flavobacterium gilvum]KFC60105.1 AraC family transcriptional regulator [Flavobacterium gilvum]